jgi:DNA topoisomerase-2
MNTGKKIEDKYKILSQVEHILHRPQTYVGSNKPNTDDKCIIVNEKIEQKKITYIPSFIKIFDEVITNSVDEHQRNKKLNKIDVVLDTDNNTISIKDNGGIPVVIHKEYKQYVPEVIFGNLMSGSNYDDTDERTVAGLNGLGAKLTNVFSEEFIVSSCDGEKHFTQIFRNNMRDKDQPIIKKLKDNHTQITYKPDLKQFNMERIDEDHFKMIEKRVYDLAGTNPDINFTFNKKKINFKSFEDYIKLYVDDFFYECNKKSDWSFGIALSENGFQQVSFANSTETYDGGTHVDYIMNQIISELREFFNKKHKVDIKPSELKNHMFLFLNSTIINPSFSSQTKEKLITEVREFGYEFIVSKKMIQSILKSEIVNSILDWIDQKKNAEENKIQRDLNKKLSKIKVEKLIDSKGKERWKSQLYIFEGDSASSSFRKYRDPQTMGAFSLRGKFINSSEISNQKLVANNEAVNLMAAIGLKLGQKVNLKDLRYGRILISSDADVDGNSITALLVNFFYRYWPELFENKMVWKLETPIVAAISKKGKKEKLLFYTQTEYDEWSEKQDLKNFEIKYKKGLAALVDDEYNDIINNPRMTLIKSDDISNDSLNIWFGKSSELRKIELLK